MPNFISDFLEYNSGTECHKNYLRWSAVAAIAMTAGLRYSLRQGRLLIRPNMYILLVGEQGVRKSYAKDQARDILSETFEDYPIGADITTRDDLVKFMAADLTERAYTGVDGEASTFHPLALFINEFKHFLSYNPVSMLSFIVDIFDRTDRVWQCSTIKRGQESITRPFLNILACENTDWLISRLKDGIITGGLSRRFVVVYELEGTERVIPRPYLPSDSDAIWERMKNHLRRIQANSREYSWDDDAVKFFDAWYVKNKANLPEDNILRGFMRTKDQMLLKLCIALDLAEENPKYRITVELLELALAWFGSIEPNMPKLYSSAGRNELAIVQQRLIELINQRGGIISEKELLKISGKDMSPFEQTQSMQFLIKTDQIIQKLFSYPEPNSPPRVWMITPNALRENAKVRAALNLSNQ